MTNKRLFVLDTNVLMHDSTALFRFMEHDIFVPMVVLEELDNHKKGLNETARNVRQVNRFLDKLMTDLTPEKMSEGIPLNPSLMENENLGYVPGRLFFQTEALSNPLPHALPGNKPDNTILATTLALQEKYPDTEVILVSKDINLRIKAHTLGIRAEDYYNDHVIDDLSLMYKGTFELDENFWDTHGRYMESWREGDHAYYKITGPVVQEWSPNYFLYSEDDDNFEAIVRKVEHDSAFIEYLKDYRKPKHHIWGVTAKNKEQNFALNALLDPDIDFVTICGAAGTGKTLLTLAAALQQTLKDKRYKEILVTRATVSVGEDIGFLPGTEEEKMTPWMGALLDNLEVLAQSQGNEMTQISAEDLAHHRIKIRSMNFMRGRTFLNKFIIIDEAQNLTAKQMLTLVTRAGPGTKIVCLGNISQIDTPYLTETTSGLTCAVQNFKHWDHSAHITLTKGERSRLADYATKVLSH